MQNMLETCALCPLVLLALGVIPLGGPMAAIPELVPFARGACASTVQICKLMPNVPS